jgi:hypothetical protein
MIVEMKDLEFGCHLDIEYYREGAQDLIRKLVPANCDSTHFHDLLPRLVHSSLEQAPCTLSFLLLCKYRQNACQFFYEMIRHWLLPSKKVNIELFFAADLRLPELSPELLSVAEIVVQVKSVHELEQIKRALPQVETEIRLGVTSHYHARKIMEFKGLSNDGKTAMIQEKICSLIQNRSKEFHREIFSSMQQFLVTCSEEFKKSRDYHHISRIISNLHSVRTLLKQGGASILVKFLKTRLIDGRPVLGILAGLALQDQERFEQSQFIDVLKKIPHVRMVEHSSFIDRTALGQANYVEIEKENGGDFSHDEIHLLRKRLPELIQAHIEKLTHPVFMPRNEEEVLRNVLTLSQQLRFVTDIPHLIITFDEQKAGELFFTIVLLRVVGPHSIPIHQLPINLPLTFDRMRTLGVVGRKHSKECSVFRTHISLAPFLRPDHSVDLYKARQFLLAQLTQALGDLRDYNGGMISKQNELFIHLKEALGSIADQHEHLLEQYFFSLKPIELRSVMKVDALKQLFLLLLQAQKKREGIKQEKERLFLVLAQPNVTKMEAALNQLCIPNHQLVSFMLDSCAGFILHSDSWSEQDRFLKTMRSFY